MMGGITDFGRYYRLLLAILGLFGVTGSTLAQEGHDPERIKNEVRRITSYYDLNAQEKYVMDNSFSTLHAMAAYRAMLNWATGNPGEMADEVHAIVYAGMKAVLVESGIGIPIADRPAIGVVFAGAEPRYTETPDPADPSSLRWNEEEVSQTVSAASVGQSLAAKAVLAQDMAKKGADGFGETVHRSLSAELETLEEHLLFQVAGDAGTGVGAGAYMPEELRLNEQGKWKVVKEQSRLFGQASLLLGLAEVIAYLDDPVASYRIDAMREQAERAFDEVYQGIESNHYYKDQGVHIARYVTGSGPEGTYLLEGSALLADALHRVMQVTENATLRREAKRKLLQEAEFLTRRVLEGRTLAPRGFWVEQGVVMTGAVTGLAEQMAAMSILLLAADAGGERRFRETARELFEAVEETFWAESSGIYRTAEGYTVSSYSGYLLGQVLQWLQRSEAAGIEVGEERDTNLLRLVLKEAGMVQADTRQTGEPESLEEMLEREAPRMAEEFAELPEREQGPRIVRLARRIMDQDGDTIPGRRFAGRPHGGAPVLVRQVSVRTPFASPARADDQTEPGDRVRSE